MNLARFRRWLTDPSLTRLKTPLGVLTTLAALSLFCGLFVHSRGFVVLAGAAAIALLGWLWPWVSLRAIDARLQLEPLRAGRLRRGREGEPLRATFTIRNRLPWAVYGLTLRGGFETIPQADDRSLGEPLASVAVVPARGTVTVEWEFIPERRGQYPRESLRIACAFPFGLWTATRPVAVERTVLVWPRPLDVGSLPDCGHRVHASGSIARDVDGGVGDLMGVRPYRRGDSLRRVHWAQTARCDRLIVCEHQSHAALSVSVSPDLDPAVHTQGVHGTFENTIRATVGIVERALALHADVSTTLADRRFHLQRDARAYERWLDALSEYDWPRSEERSGEAAHGATSSPARRSPPDSFAEGLSVIVTSSAGRGRALLPIRESSAASRWFVVLGEGRPEWSVGGRDLAAASAS